MTLFVIPDASDTSLVLKKEANDVWKLYQYVGIQDYKTAAYYNFPIYDNNKLYEIFHKLDTEKFPRIDIFNKLFLELLSTFPKILIATMTIYNIAMEKKWSDITKLASNIYGFTKMAVDIIGPFDKIDMEWISIFRRLLTLLYIDQVYISLI